MEKKTALVTGATGGIGEELCRELAKRGYDLVITARSKEKLAAQAKRLRRTYGVHVLAVAGDLGKPDMPLWLYNTLKTRGIRLDVLVNNAGYGIGGGSFAYNPARRQEDMLQVNIMAPTRLCRLFLPDMLCRGRGKILNIASTGSFVPGPWNAVYCASKAYVLSLSEALSREVKGSGVTVTAVCPGATHTGFAGRAGMEDTLLFRCGVMSPKEVARQACGAMERGCPVWVVGLGNKLLAFSTRLAPRWVNAAVSGEIQRPR